MKVTIIQRKGQAALVQYEHDGRSKRVYIPAEKVTPGGEVPIEILERSITYGIEWERFLDLSTITPEVLAKELRSKGIWTYEDLQERDRQLIRIATNLLGQVVVRAAKLSSEGD